MSGIEGEATCPRCTARVYWRLSVNNRRLSLDVAPDPTGNVIVVDLPDGRIRAKVLCGPEMPAQQEAFKQHVCPKPTQPGPRCYVCKLPMHRELAYLEQWETHPCCDPEYNRELGEQKAAGILEAA